MESRDIDLLQQLAARLGGAVPMEAPRGERRALLLRLARDVAHASERQNAPLATYLVGRYVEARRAASVSEADALREAAALATGLTGAPPGPPGS